MRCGWASPVGCVGINTQGKRVKGEAVIELKAEIDPKKIKDAE